MVFDRTCTRRGVGLSTAWSLGSVLYRGLRRLDASRGVASWAEALTWLSSYEPSRPIEEIQYWGHGRWGRVLVDGEPLDRGALAPSHRLHPLLRSIRERLVPNAASLVWLRTCEAFGARAGLDFAERLADTLGARVAGHTFIIGALQSGLHTLSPGCRAAWNPDEGIAEGTADAPVRAYWSKLSFPRTISCLDNDFPAEWLAEDTAPHVA
jgi:hypothetical protein